MQARRGPGPTTAVAARNGLGFSSLQPFRIEVAAGEGPSGEGLCVVDVPTAATGQRIGAGQVLEWVVFPEGTAGIDTAGIGADGLEAGVLETLWDATYVAVDLEFDDGTWLSAASVTDQYGGGITPLEQGAAKRLWVDQWNRRRVGLGPVAGRRIRRVVAAVRVSPQRPLRVFLDDVAVATAPQPAVAPLDLVATTRGTHSSDRFSRGNTAPLVALPHGGVFGLPMTDASRANWPYAYHQHNRSSDNRPTIQAFATSHLPSPWMGDRGVFQLMPSPLADPDPSRVARALGFSHELEQDGPHRYHVVLDGGLTAELTAGEFALGMRFRYPQDAGSVIVDHHGVVRRFSVTREGAETVVDALLDDRPGTPPHHVHMRLRGVTADRLRVEDGRLGGYLTIEGGATPAGVEVLLGISTVDAAQAAANLRAAGDVEAMAARAQRSWERRLGTLVASGATEDQAVSLYSGLYRVFLYPNRYAETAERAAPGYRSPYDPALRTPADGADDARDQEPRLGSGALSTTHGFWDTYRTVWPLLALLAPDDAGELAQGFVRHFHDGGWTPRWSAPGAEDCMTGTALDTVLADLLLRGVPGIDLDAAYAGACKNATVPADDPRVGRKGMRPGIFRGHVDTDTPEGLSWTLDNALNDWATAQLAWLVLAAGPDPARAEDLAAEREYFARRALSYRAVFDRRRGFFIGRRPDGTWRAGDDFDPDEWGHDYTETNAWGTAFAAPHDGRGLADLHGGEEALGRALDVFFARPETGRESKSGSYGFAIHEMTEARDVRMGMLGLSNQPAHHIPFMYMFAGRHDDAHGIVREALDRLFVGSDIGQGYPGDEDNGEMSAWYVLATIGLYPLVPASGTFVLVPPSVPRTEIRPLGGRSIVLEVVGGTEGGRYIRSVRVDGEPWDAIDIPHAVLAAGAHVEFELSTTPCGWARRSRPMSMSEVCGLHTVLADATGPSGLVRSPAVGNAAALFDDTGATAVTLGPGDAVEYRFPAPVTLGLYTVTAAGSGAASWRLEYRTLDGEVRRPETRDAQQFRWAGQTRAFRVNRGEPVTADAVRFVALAECHLAQLEFFPTDPGRGPDAPGPERRGDISTTEGPEGNHAR